MAVGEQFLDAYVASERVAGGSDVNDAVGILGTVVGERRDVALEVYFTGMVVDAGINHQGLSQYKIDTEETL